MTNTAELEKQIEAMVAAHVASLRKAAQSAVERAFAAAMSPATTVAPSPPRAVRVMGKRRAGSELLALGERFFEVLMRKPGETMAVLSAEVGASPAELHRAVSRLRESGRVRTIGDRSRMRYFPLSVSASG